MIEIRAPFTQFKKSNFYQPKSILGQNIKSVGLVAGFDNFKSDICLSEIDLLVYLIINSSRVLNNAFISPSLFCIIELNSSFAF